MYDQIFKEYLKNEISLSLHFTWQLLFFAIWNSCRVKSVLFILVSFCATDFFFPFCRETRIVCGPTNCSHTMKRVECTHTHAHTQNQTMENDLLTMLSKTCWANEQSQLLFIIIDFLLCVWLVYLCVLGLEHLSCFFFWVQLTSIYLLLASVCSATLRTRSRTQAYTQRKKQSFAAVAHLILLSMCVLTYTASDSHSETDIHTHFFIWIIY